MVWAAFLVALGPAKTFDFTAGEWLETIVVKSDTNVTVWQ